MSLRIRIAGVFLLIFTFFGCSSIPEDVGGSTSDVVIATGVDYSFARPSPSGLYSGGYRFACRYLSPPPNGKNLSKSEADGLWAAGIDIVANFEEAADNALNGFNQGVTDAKIADSQSQADGIPGGRPIYFSVDFDAASGQYAAIQAYFDGVASVIGLARTGAYGGYYVIQNLFNAGKIKWGWQTYAWSGGQWDSRAQLRQVLNGITAAGDANCCDKDQAVAADFGQWHANPNDPCAKAPSNGKYCGQSPQWPGGTANVLYNCQNGATASQTTCQYGCVIEDAGTDDECSTTPPPPDAGANDAAPFITQDATTSDASLEPPPVQSGGCSTAPCRAPRARDAWLLGLGAVALVRRRRRRA